MRHKVAGIFRSIANVLEIKGENPFKIRAYEKAAQNIENLTEDLEELAARDELEKIPGIGKDLAKKIKEILATGSLQYYEELKKEVPPQLVALMSIPGVGPRTAKVLYDPLKISSLSEVEEMARAHRLRGLPGIKAKTEENILRGIQLLKAARERVPLGTALPLANAVVEALRKNVRVEHLEIAGSIRRRKETIRDIDILATGPAPNQIMEAFIQLPFVREVLARGETKASVLSVQGLQIDLRVVPPESFGAALCYFTGSKEHNIRIRELAARKGLKINEYGIFRGGKRVGGEAEQDVYEILGLPYIPPELREDAGEIEAAQKGRLPDLVHREQIRGDLHVHSRFSDGSGSLEDIAAKARSLGLSWVGVCDHSRSLKIARGLSVEALMQKCEAVKQFNEQSEDVKLLCGAEVDIDATGQLDYPDDVLARLDLVLAALHSGFK
ncbi:MAG: helix-hairpin-helix domain-containing protein, partial [Desulfotomaculales bacterium]